MYLLNIGLMTNDGEQVSLPWLRSALTLARVNVRRSAVLQSSTEPTFVAELGGALSTRQLEQLAHDLKQDCIAYYSSDWQAGTLVGPKPWGAFDADQFMLVSGGFLGDALKLARMSDAQFEEALSMPRRASCGCVTPDGRPGRCDDCKPRVREGMPSPNCHERDWAAGHYVGLDRPAWDSSPEARRIYGTRDAWSQPLEAGDESCAPRNF